MIFDLSSLAEPNKHVVKIEYVMKYSTLRYFESVKHLDLYMECPSCTHQNEMFSVAHHDIIEADIESEWLELTMECVDCEWNSAAEILLTLHMADENNITIPFNEDFTPFLVVYVYTQELFPETVLKTLEKRQITDNFTETQNYTSSMNQTDDTSINHNSTTENSTYDEIIYNNNKTENRTTLEEIESRNTSCSVHTISLTPEELGYEDTAVIGPGIIISFCFGHCNLPTDKPSTSEYANYFRTRVMMYSFSLDPGDYPLPSCIPSVITATSVILNKGDLMELNTIPLATECKCTL